MIEKKGAPEKIVKVIKIIGDAQFCRMKDEIGKENNLIRCPKCGKLLSKVTSDRKTLQHRGLEVVIEDGIIHVRCTKCGTPISIE